ncbi:MAG: metal-dependent transcriptional regulator [Planctomycetaceae bacterium]
MPSLTVENYCKAIRQLSQRGNWPWVAPGQIASHLGVTPGTVTSMLRTLSDAMLVEYRPYEGVQLTVAGEGLATRVLRRHRLIEAFLVQTLGLTWDQVHEEAEHMEHAVSDALIDRIDAFLGHPPSDPHGDPIPESDGTLRVEEAHGDPLSAAGPGERFRVTRVLQQSPEFLRYLSGLNISIGIELSVVEKADQGVRVVIGDAETGIWLSPAETAQVLVLRIS